MHELSISSEASTILSTLFNNSLQLTHKQSIVSRIKASLLESWWISQHCQNELENTRKKCFITYSQGAIYVDALYYASSTVTMESVAFEDYTFYRLWRHLKSVL